MFAGEVFDDMKAQFGRNSHQRWSGRHGCGRGEKAEQSRTLGENIYIQDKIIMRTKRRVEVRTVIEKSVIWTA
jgi:hypothetical protein